MNTLGKLIRDSRKAKKFTLEEVGEKVGVTGAALSMYENDKREPTARKFIKLMKYLGIKKKDLFKLL